MRNHGWHLPYHPLQIVAVAVFSALAFSFYVFFVPFVGSSVLKFHIIAAFSPLVLAVFVLYVRCAAIDPADSGIKCIKRTPRAGDSARKPDTSGDILYREPGVPHGTSDDLDDELRRDLQLEQAPEEDNRWERNGGVCSCLCCPVVAICGGCSSEGEPLRCTSCGDSSESDKYTPEEELLFCSLCEAEILKSSKHCRACDKCVDGFDHHCRWLNNCIGRKNYKTFVAVMIVSLFMLVMEWSIGIFVLVRCFSNKPKFDKEIVDKLGSSFTRTPFIVVVILCTFLAMLATLPLTQLLFFHLILIKKGITTYDYIVAIREQETQEPLDEFHGDGSPFSSPTSSIATMVSGGSSSGAMHRGVWCTPPRMFVDNQSNMKAGVLSQHSSSLRNSSPKIDFESAGEISSRYSKDAVRQPKRQVGLSAWKLARLSAKDATRAAIRARENSSILRPVKGGGRGTAATETEDSSFESSAELSNTPGKAKAGWKLDVGMPRGDSPGLGHERRNPLFHASVPADLLNGRLVHHGAEKGRRYPILPLRTEATSPYRSRSLNTMPSFSLTGSATDSPDLLESPDLMSGDMQQFRIHNQERSWLYRATSDGYEASGGESADDISDQGPRAMPQAWGRVKLTPNFINGNENQRGALKWSGGLDHAMMIPRSQPASRASSICETRSNGSRIEANILKHVKKDWPGFRDRLPTSTDGSNNSSPSQHMSPQLGVSPDVFYGTDIHIDKPKLEESGVTFYERPFSEGSPGLMASKRSLSSAKRLKESLFSYKRGLSSSSRSGALLSSSP